MNKVTRKMGEEPQVLHKEYSACNSQTIAKVGMAAFGLLGVGGGLAFYFLQMSMIVAFSTGTLGVGTLLGTTMWSVIDAIVPPNQVESSENEWADEGPSTSGWSPVKTLDASSKIQGRRAQEVHEIKLTVEQDRMVKGKPFAECELEYQLHEDSKLNKITIEIKASQKAKDLDPDFTALEAAGFKRDSFNSRVDNTQNARTRIDRYIFTKRA